MKAYTQLYELLSGVLLRFSYSIVRSHEMAEEIVSDVFIKLWQIRDKLLEIENLKVYLYTIAKNFSLNYIAKNNKHRIVSLETIDVEAVITVNGPAENVIVPELLSPLMV